MKKISDFPNQIDIMEISYQLHKAGLKKEIIDFWINRAKNKLKTWVMLRRWVVGLEKAKKIDSRVYSA